MQSPINSMIKNTLSLALGPSPPSISTMSNKQTDNTSSSGSPKDFSASKLIGGRNTLEDNQIEQYSTRKLSYLNSYRNPTSEGPNNLKNRRSLPM